MMKKPITTARYVLVTGLISLLLLSACSTPQYSPTLNTPAADATTIPDSWTLHAKLGIRNGEDSGSVTLQWQQQKTAYRIRVSGPFGQGNALLIGNEQYISIERPGKETVLSYQPELLIKETFGWHLPIQQLRYWVSGLPAPDSPLPSNASQLTLSPSTDNNEQFNNAGLLSQRQQYGWTLDYSRYKPVASLGNQLLAHKIRAQQTSATLTLIVKEWDFNNHSALPPVKTTTPP
ncbi:lipoprotein insertase outer membrane protein LolB [Eionea flava]